MIFKSARSWTGFFVLVLVILISGNSSSASPWKLAVTDPCLASMASFLGGVNLSVVSMSGWKNGKLVRYDLKGDDMPRRVLCMDRADARKYGLSTNSDDVAILYRDLPVSRSVEALFSDPASLPFVGQRILVAISDLDPGGYEYYQRRLAEFQSRLDGIVSMGRKLLKGSRILSLSGVSDMLFIAAGCSVDVPTSEMASQLDDVLSRRGSTKKELVDVLTSWKNGYDAVLVDHLSDPRVADAASGVDGYVWIDSLRVEMDPVGVLNDRYLAVWDVLRSKEN